MASTRNFGPGSSGSYKRPSALTGRPGLRRPVALAQSRPGSIVASWLARVPILSHGQELAAMNQAARSTWLRRRKSCGG